MAIERAQAHAHQKPWGAVDLRPWSSADGEGGAVGEIWYERLGSSVRDSSLLLKLLFVNQPLSIQVHPDDTFAHSIGLPRGKTEAWYVLSTAPQAKVALGLDQRMTASQLREAIGDGSISDHVVWRSVSANDAIFVPAGTIHAIGAGLVVAEIQQRSDATFRMFDHGRRRALHIENAVAVANIGPADFQVQPTRFSAERIILVSCPYFVFEKINLPSNSSWCLEAERETWLLVLSGAAIAGAFDIGRGDAVFAQSDRFDIHTGSAGMVGLVAYTGGSSLPHLLENLTKSGSIDLKRPEEMQVQILPTTADTAPKNGQLETIK